MKLNIISSIAFAAIALAIATSTPAISGSLIQNGDNLAASLTKQMNAKHSAKPFGLWGVLLDMGARANGTLKDAGAKHQAWCQKYTRNYDAGSNTYELFNGKRMACISPYGK